ncbi:hypothetical protein QN277_006146 [Acacia crassicarpa]|uniref:Uncharacterized protein n=1 Tax=Acacia crassicarpa TaxID=499986 RepID=A0AAE1MH14_9FABA|nr:hypothetical protein QN277_006146 [Acacia crassicarpa]
MSMTTVTSLLQLDCTSNNWIICVKVVGNFWDIPSMKKHRQITFNAVLADSEGYIALAIMRRRDVIRRLCGVLVPGFCFLLKKFSVEEGANIINPDLKIVIEEFTQIEYVFGIIQTPETIFQPLLPIAATTICETTLKNVVGLVTCVYPLNDVKIDGETHYQLNFEIMDESGNPFHCCFRGTPAFWAAVSYSIIDDKDDIVVALLWVKMIRLSDGQILFQSHCDLS